MRKGKISELQDQIFKKLPFEIKNQNLKNNCLSMRIAKNYFISYRRQINVIETNTILVSSDIEKAAIQNVQAGTSVFLTFHRLSVQ